jgi:uncharacterized repeat protein (TIGR02543 family)
MVLAGDWTRRRRLIGVLSTLALLIVAGAVAVSTAYAAGTVSVSVTGQGSVTGDGINCTQSGGPDCSEAYADEEDCYYDPEIGGVICDPVLPVVTLVAGSDSNGFVFDGWTGCDGGTARNCELTVDDDRSVTARFRDAQAPVVSGLTPANGAVLNGTRTLAAGASDNSGSIARVEFRVRGTPVGSPDTTAPYSVSFDTTTVSNGSATIQATAFDAAGNAGSLTSNVTLDNSAPNLSINSGPNGANLGTGTTQTWTFSASDSTSGIQSILCSVVQTGQPASFGSCSGGSGSHSVTSLPEGHYTFSVRARDNGGLDNVQTRAFTIDGTAPTLDVTSGPDGEIFGTGSTQTWNFDASDATSGLQSVRCSLVNTGSAAAFSTCSGGDSSHSVTDLADGHYTFSVRARDNVGLEVTETRSFTVDGTAPTLDITSGPDGGIFGAGTTQTWNFDASDATSGLEPVQCSVVTTGSPASFADCSGGDGSHSADGLADGDYTFTVRARDNGGLETTQSRTFTKDATAPTLGITSGPDGEAIPEGGTQTWSFSASDAHLQSVECSVGGTGSTPSYAPCSASHSVSGLAAGNYTFRLRARDTAANETVQTRSFSIVPAGNTGTPGGNTGGPGGNTGAPGGNTGGGITDSQIASLLASDLATAARTLGGQRLSKLARKGSVGLRFNALLAGRFALAFKGAATKQKAARSIVIAKGSRSVTASGAYTVTLKLTRAGKRLLKGGRRVKGRLSASFTKAGGGTLTGSTAVALKRR